MTSSSSRRSTDNLMSKSRLVRVEVIYTESLTAEIISGKVKIKDEEIAVAPYNKKCQLLQSDLQMRSVNKQTMQMVAANEFRQRQKETQKKPKPKRKRVVAVPHGKSKVAERRRPMKTEADLEKKMEATLMEMNKKVAEIKIASEPFLQQEKPRDEKTEAIIQKKKELEKSNVLLSNMILRILSNVPRGTLPMAEVKLYEELTKKGRGCHELE